MPTEFKYDEMKTHAGVRHKGYYSKEANGFRFLYQVGTEDESKVKFSPVKCHINFGPPPPGVSEKDHVAKGWNILVDHLLNSGKDYSNIVKILKVIDIEELARENKN